MIFQDIETERLILKCIAVEDRDFIYEHFSNQRVNQYLFDTEPVASLQDADRIIALFIQPEPRTQHRWVLVTKDEGIKIGTCGFHCWNQMDGSCDVGYDLNPDYWGKGYMKEAMEAILAFAKNHMNIKRVDACIYPENENSAKLAKKLGFIYNGETKEEVLNGITYGHQILTLDYTMQS